MEEQILYKRQGQTALITINRPKALNALNKVVLLELKEKLEQIAAEPEIKVVIITGAGEKAFVAGADIEFMKHLTPQEAREFSILGHQIFDFIEKMDCVVIAAIAGYALGGGCELAMACDIRVGATKASLGLPEASLGLIPGFGGTQRLPRLVGLSIAKEMLATGRRMKAEEALSRGLMNYVVESEQLMDFCYELSELIAKNSKSAIAFGKHCMNAGSEMDQDKGMDMEADCFGLVFATPDAKEGVDAFLEKRKPVWN